MNYFLLTAAIVSLLSVIGHFTMGIKLYMNPVMNSDLDNTPKYVMLSLFHYMSVTMSLSTIVLFMPILKPEMMSIYSNIIFFIGIMYCGFALAQFLVAVFSPIKRGPFQMFQWVFWVLIGVFSLLGI